MISMNATDSAEPLTTLQEIDVLKRLSRSARFQNRKKKYRALQNLKLHRTRRKRAQRGLQELLLQSVYSTEFGKRLAIPEAVAGRTYGKCRRWSQC